MNYPLFKNKLKQFLQKQSDCYVRSVKNNTSKPTDTLLAMCLHQKCPSIPVRRFQKYLSDRTEQEQLAITVTDLLVFAELAGMSLSDFILQHLEGGITYESKEKNTAQ